ncbi:NAD-dependent dehydratase [Candidatus Gottesmanbacteria bacterium RIFCSPHIGHO2_02_FULL_40_13]|uniref:NAD-dependent dehydratase n=1 Tax=Candidatus Gottesmanbacteria bacterium RIFCSPHIGHO2_02_FULL_40_13 TaxID=1798384 RepID=A0A1F6A5K2_9BACT|nr:MAG: NAD-dependent dehydratase [Candidatus Gottesmanbacteria bacterium RIFCSPHIGHO2_02_FULL_40_13]
MRSLVTGGLGFIGSHLVESLLKDQHEVIVLDDLSTGCLENLLTVKNNSSLTLQKIDITDPKIHLDNYFKGVDLVFHLAARANVVPSIEKPFEYHNVNVNGTVRVLEAARRRGVKKFIYTASSSCYGIPESYPTLESAKIDPRYPYALTKYLAEQYVLHWGKIYKLPVVSLRLFNVFGPRSRTSGTYGAVFGVFLAQKLAGKPLTVVGDGRQSRDFTFVSDVVEALVKAANSKVVGEVFNVGSGKPQSVNRLVKLLGGSVTYIPNRPGEPDCTWADTSKIKNKLGWKPRVSFETGVKILLRNIDYWKKAPVWTPRTIEKSTKEWFKYLTV